MTWKRFRVGPWALTALAASVVLAGPMVSNAAAASPASTGKHCAVVVGKQRDAQGFSVVEGAQCSDVSAAAARAGVVPNASTPLMAWFADINYGGASTVIYGSDGGCDDQGYSLNPRSRYIRSNFTWGHALSSEQGIGTCTKAQMYTYDLTYAGTFSLPYSYFGPYLNDNVGRIQVYRG